MNKSEQDLSRKTVPISGAQKQMKLLMNGSLVNVEYVYMQTELSANANLTPALVCHAVYYHRTAVF